eukprot:TRINITY_DN16541_c0_g1_i1.p1 TRINITY_DN16541_c0_g1~~TRINITY_DN16541_c0_g1_i1.p1  ORF type:complete len:749 (+),score=221.30 TRINITY_DN16541_c0_g1_i1:335-2248(+)
MHESPNMLRDLYYGGWVAPNIYYLGYAGAVRCGPLRIVGLSGVFKGGDYFRGHYEFPPYTESTLRSSYAVRDWDVARLEKLGEGAPIDIVVSYDWPRGIWKHGNHKDLLAQEDLDSDTRREIEGGTFGSPAAMELLQKLRPGFWFAGRVGRKFPALVRHKDSTFTRFLNLDKCTPGHDFLQVLDIEHKSPAFLTKIPPAGEKRRWGGVRRRDKAPTLDHDPEWLALQKVNHAGLTFSYKTQKASIRKPTKDEISWVIARLREAIGASPRPLGATRRHDMLLPIAHRQGGKEAYRDLKMAQLRELFETRGLEFQGHLDKSSLVKQLEDHDEFFAAERAQLHQADDEAFAIPAVKGSMDRDSPAQQRKQVLRLLELEDYWAQQEAELRKLQRADEPDYDPFSEAPAAHVGANATDGDLDDEDSGDEGARAAQAPGGTTEPLQDDGAGDDEDDSPVAAPADDDGAGDDEDAPDLPPSEPETPAEASADAPATGTSEAAASTAAPASTTDEGSAAAATAMGDEDAVPEEDDADALACDAYFADAAADDDADDLDAAAGAATDVGAAETAAEGEAAVADAGAPLAAEEAEMEEEAAPAAGSSWVDTDPYAALLAEAEAAEFDDEEEEADATEPPLKVPRLGA